MQRTLADWLSEGPFTLALSSSFFGFYAHCGVVAAFETLGLKPAKVTGSSAGALIAGAMASGLNSMETKKLLFSIQRPDFWDPGFGLGYLRGRKFHDLLVRSFVSRFEDASLPFEVAVFDVMRFRTEFIHEGPVASAIAASCAVPMMFHPVVRRGRLLLDGGVLEKSGINPRDERVLCVFLESKGWMGAYERRTSFSRLKAGHKIVRFKSLPKVNMMDLSTGQHAFAEAYRRALGLFELRLQSENIFDI